MSTNPSRWHARPRNWAIVAAACAVMVCGAIWPLPVVGAGGTLVAAVALVHGIRAFRTEQRTEPDARPDPSGPDPETARTDPDTTGQGAAEQPGPDPDALRMRVGDAIREYLKANTRPSILSPFGERLPSLFSATEYDIADVALAEITAAGYCPHCGRGDLAPTADDWAQQAARAVQAEELLDIAHATSNRAEAERARAAQRAAQAEAAITRVRELHAKWKHGDSSPNTYCKHCEVDNDVVRYPCATIRALDVPVEGSSW